VVFGQLNAQAVSVPATTPIQKVLTMGTVAIPFQKRQCNARVMVPSVPVRHVRQPTAPGRLSVYHALATQATKIPLMVLVMTATTVQDGAATTLPCICVVVLRSTVPRMPVKRQVVFSQMVVVLAVVKRSSLPIIPPLLIQMLP
jgi:hypothetical protein